MHESKKAAENTIRMLTAALLLLRAIIELVIPYLTR